MPPRCQECKNPVGNDGLCTSCGLKHMEVTEMDDRKQAAKRFLSPGNSDAEPPVAKRPDTPSSAVAPLPDCPSLSTFITEGDLGTKGIKGKGGIKDLIHGMKGKGKTHVVVGKGGRKERIFGAEGTDGTLQVEKGKGMGMETVEVVAVVVVVYLP